MDLEQHEISTDAVEYSIIHIPHNEAGVRKYVNQYKALRLFSLEYAPEAFGSTYGREVNFEDKIWFARLSNLIINTFLAFRDADNVIGMSTIVGPLTIGILDMPPAGVPQSVYGGWDGASPLHFRLNAIFTKPEARRKGISKALVEASIKYVMSEATARNKTTIFSIIVDTNNLPARALYESVGFVEAARHEASDNNYGRAVIVFEYRPVSPITNASKV